MRINIIKRIPLIAAGLIAAAALAGCSIDEENKTSFELNKDGSVTQIIVDDNSIAATGEEIEDYINKELTVFSEENGAESVSLENCRATDEKVNLEMRYGTVNAYSAFNDVLCFNGTLKEAYDQGYDFNRLFFAANGAAIPFFELPYLFKEGKVLILEEAMTVKVPGDLAAYSSGVTIGAHNTISIDSNYDESVDEIFRTTLMSPVFIIYI